MPNESKILIAGLEVTPFCGVENATSFVFDRLIGGKGTSAIALNPEKVVSSIDDTATRARLMSASLLYADGIGVVKAVNKKANISSSRVPGCELWQSIMERAGKEGQGVFLVGAAPGVAEAVARKLQGKYSTPIVGVRDGYFNDEQEIVSEVCNSGASIVAVALGSPRQEAFINACIERGGEAFHMGVGGSFDVFSGRVARAPDVFLRLHLEWLYRLLGQPSRIFRQKKLIRFLLMYVLNKL